LLTNHLIVNELNDLFHQKNIFIKTLYKF